MADIYEEVGRRVRQAREAVGLSQADLAQRIGMSRTTITNIEQGGQRIPVHVVFDLADVLGTPAHELLPKEQSRESLSVMRRVAPKERAWVHRVIHGEQKR